MDPSGPTRPPSTSLTPGAGGTAGSSSIRPRSSRPSSPGPIGRGPRRRPRRSATPRSGSSSRPSRGSSRGSRGPMSGTGSSTTSCRTRTCFAGRRPCGSPPPGRRPSSAGGGGPGGPAGPAGRRPPSSATGPRSASRTGSARSASSLRGSVAGRSPGGARDRGILPRAGDLILSGRDRGTDPHRGGAQIEPDARPSPGRPSSSLPTCLGPEDPVAAGPEAIVFPDLVLEVVHPGPVLERLPRAGVPLPRRRALVEPEGLERLLHLLDRLRGERDGVRRILAVEEGRIVHVEDPHELLDGGRMVVHAEVDPAGVEAAG